MLDLHRIGFYSNVKFGMQRGREYRKQSGISGVNYEANHFTTSLGTDLFTLEYKVYTQSEDTYKALLINRVQIVYTQYFLVLVLSHVPASYKAYVYENKQLTYCLLLVP